MISVREIHVKWVKIVEKLHNLKIRMRSASLINQRVRMSYKERFLYMRAAFFFPPIDEIYNRMAIINRDIIIDGQKTYFPY